MPMITKEPIVNGVYTCPHCKEEFIYKETPVEFSYYEEIYTLNCPYCSAKITENTMLIYESEKRK